MARKTTYGAKGNASKQKAKKESKDKTTNTEESKPKKVYKRKESTESILNSIDTKSLAEELEVYKIPEDLRDSEISEEEKRLYDNSYISQELQDYKGARDDIEVNQYLFDKLKAKALSQSEVFTDWDVKIGDPIEFFDPDLSYEITGYRPITETQGLDFNPDWFREDAMTKEATGKYEMYAINGPAYSQFWLERLRRCTEGYTSHGYTITGWNYFYLNFYRMQTPIILDLGSGKSKSKRATSFPMFIAKQYEYFHYIEIARRSNQDALVLKGRGLGFSEMGANNGVAMYTCERESQSLYTAFTSDFLAKTLEKCWVQLDYLNTQTEGGFKHLRQAINTQLQKRSSKKDKEGNESGFKSMITGIVADKASKVRGDRCELLIYEEAGSDPELVKKWIQGDALIKVIGQRVGFKIAYGTGGDSGPALEGLERMFLDPISFGILPYKHNYSTDGKTVYTGYFIPSTAIVLQKGIIDNRGVTIRKKAEEFLMIERNRYANDPFAYMVHCAEYCWTFQEALSRKGDNMFNQELIAQRITDIEVHGYGTKPKIGIVDLVGDDRGGKDRYRFIPSPNGKVEIYEEPIRDENGDLIPNLYVAGIDSIDQGVDQSTGQKDTSDYCLVIKKRNYGLGGNKYVAIYKDRPRNIREAYNQTIKLLEWYGAKAVLESSRTAIVNHFQDRGKQNLLMKKLQSSNGSEVSRKKASSSTMYGIYPSKQTIEYYLELIADYVNEYWDRIDSLKMLNELKDYSYENKRKFDIIAAVGMAEMGDQELRLLGGIGEKKKKMNLAKIGYYYDSNGVKHFGKIPSNDGIPDDLKILISRTDSAYD